MAAAAAMNASEAVLRSLAHENRHLSGQHMSQQLGTTIKGPMCCGDRLVSPGSSAWLALHRLRERKVTGARKAYWLKRLRWYKKHGYEEFCFDFICANDLICWADEEFVSRNGAVYDQERPTMTLALLDEFCLVMEDWFSANGCPYPILNNDVTCHVWQGRCKCLVGGGHGSELSFVLKALELYGAPALPSLSYLAMQPLLKEQEEYYTSIA